MNSSDRDPGAELAATRRRGRGMLGRLLALIVLTVALAYIESALVVYLREVIAPLRSVHFPGAAREMLPLLRLEHVREAGPQYLLLLRIEVGREMTPIVVLLAAAWVLGRSARQVVGFFLLGFGVWDIFYYVWLKVLLDWPASLGTWDVLFLIPTAWVAPVWAPLVVSVTLAAAGAVLVVHRCGRVGRARAIGSGLAISVGCGLVLMSFFLRTGEAFGRVPERFDWEWFCLGWVVGVGGVVWRLLSVRIRAQTSLTDAKRPES